MSAAAAAADRNERRRYLSEQGRADLKVLMTVDAVGGVWRYAMDLARSLSSRGIRTTFVGLGPRPTVRQAVEAQEIGGFVWLDQPLDWMVEDREALAGVPQALSELAVNIGADLLHLNLPSQAAGLDCALPTLVVSHSCIATWWEAVKATPLPEGWQWQRACTQAGFAAADRIVAPSRSHARAIASVYEGLSDVTVVHNAASGPRKTDIKADYVFAAARWWDEGKNGATLDAAARFIRWPVVTAGAATGPNGQSVTMRHVTFEGELAHSATMGLVQKAGIVVSPSLYEPFGLAVLEGASAGAALVLSDIPTYRELWEGAAVFFEPRDPRALARAVNALIVDPKLRFGLGDKAHQRSRAYAPAAQATRMCALYGDLVHSRSTRREHRPS
ncbi:MAG: glycosyltransferase family 4 protein [Pararhizobium sp.]